MRRSILACFFIVAAAALAAGCSGSLGPVPSTGSSQGGTQPSNTSVRHRRRRAAATFQIRIPRKPRHRRRGPRYVSYNTHSIGIAVTPAKGSPLPLVRANVGPTAPGCHVSGSSFVCQIDAVAVRGVVNTFAVTAYEGTNATGSVLSQGSVATLIPATGAVAPVALTLGGVVSALSLTFPGAAGSAGYVPIGSTSSLDLQAKDASGETIVGAYSAPVTVSASSSHVLLDGSSSRLTFNSSPASPIAVSYAGAPTYEQAPTSNVSIEASMAYGSDVRRRNDVGAAAAILHPIGAAIAIAAGALPSGWYGPSIVAAPSVSSSGLLAFALTASISSPSPAPAMLLGTFDPATGNVVLATAAQTYAANGVTFDGSGNLWVNESYQGAYVSCYASLESAGSPHPVPNAASGMATDGSGNVWFPQLKPGIVASFYPASACTGEGDITNVTAAGYAASYVAAAPTQTLVYAGDGAGDLFSMTAQGTSGNVLAPLPVPSGAVDFYADGLAADGSGNAWAAMTVDTESSESGALIEVSPSGPESTTAVVVTPQYVAASGSMVATAGFVDSSYNAVAYDSAGHVSLLSAGSAFPELAPGGTVRCQPVFFDAHSGLWQACFVAASYSSNPNVYFVHLITSSAGFALSYDPNSFYASSPAVVGIAGGNATDTYSVACDTTVFTSCALDPTYAGLIDVEVGYSGGSQGTITVTDQTTGQVQAIAVTPNSGEVIRRPSSTCVRRFDAHRRPACIAVPGVRGAFRRR